jgi:hypothetical protein
VGQGIRAAIDELGVKREELWITSKLWNSNHRKEHVKWACEATLKDLGLGAFTFRVFYGLCFGFSGSCRGCCLAFNANFA